MGPTVLTNVDARMDVVSEEIFGPALTVQPDDDIEPIFRALAMSAFRSARTGGVIVVPARPGGGPTSPKFAIRDMTQERLLVIN